MLGRENRGQPGGRGHSADGFYKDKHGGEIKNRTENLTAMGQHSEGLGLQCFFFIPVMLIHLHTPDNTTVHGTAEQAQSHALLANELRGNWGLEKERGVSG